MYPYSQEDIPPLTPQQQRILHQKYGPPNYQPHEALSSYRNQQYLPQQLHTSVEISPSHGFEIKQTNNGYETYSQQTHQQYDNQNYRPISFQPEHQTGPVIVLRIPGPQKYATHLQALLQQYLEIRATEYIKLLQEQELQQQHGQQAHNYQQYSYEPTQHGEQVYQNQYHQSYEPSPHYQVQVQPAQIVYQKHEESTDDRTQQIHYSHDEVNVEPQDEHGDHAYNYQPTYRPVSHYAQQTEENEHYYHSDEYQQHSSGAEEQHQHYVYPKIPSTTESSLQITENFPRDTHTHAYFTKSTTKPPTYVTPQHHSYQDQAQDQHYDNYQPQNYQQEEVDYYYDNQQQSDKDYGSPSEQSHISIAPTTPVPYNYHAHPPHSSNAHTSQNSDEHASLKGAKRQTSSFTQEQYAKLNKLISRMKKKAAHTQKNKESE